MYQEVIVTRDTYSDCLREILTYSVLAIDTETTGLYPFGEDRLFSVAIATKDKAWYFNFQDYPNADIFFKPEYILDTAPIKILGNQDRLWIGHNLKFDLKFLKKFGLFLQGSLVDTKSFARVFENQHAFYSLDACSERHLDERKDSSVLEWLDKNHAYRKRLDVIRQKTVKDYQFYLAPFDLISKYAMKDTWLTYKLYEFFSEKQGGYPQFELEATKILWAMEERGVLLDQEYVDDKIGVLEKSLGELYYKFKELTGHDYTDSEKSLAPILESLGVVLPLTEKGNRSISDEALEGSSLAEVNVIREIRGLEKTLNTYFKGYKFFADRNSVVHPDFDSQGTRTGRLSCRDPNLQNIPKEDVWGVRNSFVPRPGFYFVSIDYNQMEFRLMLDYANEQKLIDMINQGHDPHQATADITGLSRKAAKTLNFGLLYGMGVAKLAKALGVTEKEAYEFKATYFAKLPMVQRVINLAKKRMQDVGYIRTIGDRLLTVDDMRFSYKAINYLIQGGCADIMKKAMSSVFQKLEMYPQDIRPYMLLQIHDELVFEVPKHLASFSMVEDIKRRMESAYVAKNNMSLTCSLSYSLKSLGELTECKSFEDFRSQVLAEDPEGFTQAS